MATTNWEPIEKNWGDLAHDEVMRTFEGQMKNRAVALCVWYLAVEPGVSQQRVEQIAQRDPEIEPKKNGNKVNDYSMRQAKKILRGDGGKKRPRKSSSKRRTTKPATESLSPLEAALVAKFQSSAAIVDEFTQLSEQLTALQDACEKARKALLEIPEEHAVTLADVDPKAAKILAQEGILRPTPELA